MKVASLIARTAAGWFPLAQGDDIAAIKKQFKEIRTDRVLAIGDLPADCVILFDTAGRCVRKKLKDAETNKLVNGLNELSPEETALVQEIVDEANSLADETAAAVVDVVRAAIAPLAGSMSEQPSADVVVTPAAESSEQPAPVVAAESAPEDDAAEHFGAKKNKPPTKR